MPRRVDVVRDTTKHLPAGAIAVNDLVLLADVSETEPGDVPKAAEAVEIAKFLAPLTNYSLGIVTNEFATVAARDAYVAALTDNAWLTSYRDNPSHVVKAGTRYYKLESFTPYASGSPAVAATAVWKQVLGGGVGLTEAQVRAEIVAGVQQPFRAGQDLTNLDALGSSDAQGGDQVIVEDSGVFKKMSLGQFAAWLQNEAVIDWAQVGNDDPIPGSKLVRAPNQAADFAKRSGGSGTIPLARAGTGAATAGKILKVNSDGTALEYADEASGGTGGGGLNQEEVDARVAAGTAPVESEVELLKDFQQLLEVVTPIVTNARIVVSTRNEGIAIPGAASVPTDEPGARLAVTVTAVGEAAGSLSVDLSDLYAKTPVVRGGLAMTDTNSLSFTNTPDDNVYRIGRDTSGDWFFAGDTGDTYMVSISVTKLKDSATKKAADELEALAALPAVANYSLGDIVNVSGVLYELVASTLDPHVHRGTVGDRAGNLIGDDTFEWEGVSPFNIRAALSKAVLGASPPSSLYVEFHSSDGQYAETKMDRASGSDTSTTYAYHRDPQNASFNSAPIGSTFSVAFYSDENKTIQVRVQASGVNRWEPDDRNQVRIPAPAPDVTQAEAEAGTETAVRRWSPQRVAQAIAALESPGGGGGISTEDAQDAAAGMMVTGAAATGSEIAATYRDTDNALGLSIKGGVVDPAKMDVASGNVAGNVLQIGPGASQFVGVDLPRVHGQTGLDHTFGALVVPRTDGKTRPAAASFFSPAFDLDDTFRQRGEFHASLTVTIAPVSDVNMGFREGVSGATTEDRTRQLANIVFASAIIAEQPFVYSASANLAGLVLFSQSVYSAATEVGRYNVLMVKNTDNQVGVYQYWDGDAGATGATFNAALRMSFTPADAAGSGSPTSGEEAPDPVYPALAADVALPLGAANDEYGAWTEVFRHTATDAEQGTLYAALTAKASWTPTGGGDRIGIRYRVRHLNSSDVVQRVLLADLDIYLRNSNAPLVASSRATEAFSVPFDIEATDYIVIEGQAAAQVRVSGNTVNVLMAESNFSIQELPKPSAGLNTAGVNALVSAKFTEFGLLKIRKLTVAEFNALTEKDANTLYLQT